MNLFQPSNYSQKQAFTQPVMPVVERSHHAQSPLNADILNHVARYEPCGFGELYDVYGDVQTDNKTKERFRARLNYLAESGQLQAKGTASHRRWYMPSVGVSATTAMDEETLPAWLGAVVPPAQNDVMHCASYVPEAGPVTRSGALNFKNIASRGYQC